MTAMQGMTGPIPRPARRGGLRLRISADTRNFVMFTLWCCVTFVVFPGDQLLLYPLALYFAWAIWRDQRRIVPLMARAWILLLFPAWCLVSTLWAVVPGDALKHVVYLTLTMMICFQVAATMSPRRIVHAVLLATGTIGVINILFAFATGDLSTGIFYQKNAMGKYMTILWTVAVAVTLDRGSAAWIRLAALGLAGIGIVAVLLSHSATAALLSLATLGINVAGAAFLVGGLGRASRIAILCFTMAGISGAGAVILPSFQANPVVMVLDYFGKDTTVTGRTVLWRYAEDQIAEQPMLGVGAGGFWRYHSSPLVQKIFEDFYKRPRDKFDFHNSYYEITVHQGRIGFALAALTMLWATWHITRGALGLATMPQVFFLAQMLAVFARVPFESDFLKPFTLTHMLIWIGAMSTIQITMRRRRDRAAQAPGRPAGPAWQAGSGP